MKHKKIFVLAYARCNLGDDLFIYMLLKQYPNSHFYIHIKDSEHAKLFEQFSNITIIPEAERILTKENAKEYDQYIYVGGSIFMEGGVVYNISEQFLDFMKECKKSNIPFNYISSNFGPSYTEQYIKLAKKVYQNCTDICFRDKNSYNMFQEIPSVRYAPDLAFCCPIRGGAKKANTVGISVIDLLIRKPLKEKEQIYYKMLAHNIVDYIHLGKEVYLFSFCKYEGDERAIQQLIKILPTECKNHVHTIYYDGNLEEFLKIYQSMEYIICSRFHAMILSVIMEQKCRILSYSNKIDYVIEDLQLFKQKVVRFEELEEDFKMPLEEFESVPKEKMNEITKKAKEQLKSLDKVIQELK